MENEQADAGQTAEPVSRDQILRHVRGHENINFPCSADHEQDWQPYPVDPYSAICDDHTYIHTHELSPWQNMNFDPGLVQSRSFAPASPYYVCVCVFFPSILDIKFVGRTSRGHTGFLIHLPSAVRALIFVARRIQPFLSLVDREVEFCVLTN